MTLAARCPSCGTVFRVVQDQLRVSEGWVRCGRCAEVFNAIDTLVEVETELPPRAPMRTGGASSERVMADLARVSRAERTAAPAVPPALPTASEVPGAPAEPAAAESNGETATPTASAGDPPAPVASDRPAFVLQAEKAARWRRPGVRASLAASCVALASLLGAQAAIEFRDIAAARWPVLRPALAQACSALGCRIEAPRAIDQLAVDSSGLVRIEGTSLYRLTVVLRNAAAFALSAPAIDLTLTDSQGGVIARRVLRAADFGALRDEVPPGTPTTLQAALGGPDRPVSGYTIEIFYP